MKQPHFETKPLCGIHMGELFCLEEHVRPISRTYDPGFLVQGLLGLGPKNSDPKKPRFRALVDEEPIHLSWIWVPQVCTGPQDDGDLTMMDVPHNCVAFVTGASHSRWVVLVNLPHLAWLQLIRTQLCFLDGLNHWNRRYSVMRNPCCQHFFFKACLHCLKVLKLLSTHIRACVLA